MVEQLADSKLFVSLCRDRRGHYPFVFISFISRKAEELEQNLSPNHMVCGNTRFFKSLTTTLEGSWKKCEEAKHFASPEGC
jgi:hypothetical protein